VQFILNKPVFIDHLSYVTIFQYSLGKSHKTGLTVYSLYISKLTKGHFLRMQHCLYFPVPPNCFMSRQNMQVAQFCLAHASQFFREHGTHFLHRVLLLALLV